MKKVPILSVISLSYLALHGPKFLIHRAQRRCRLKTEASEVFPSVSRARSCDGFSSCECTCAASVRRTTHLSPQQPIRKRRDRAILLSLRHAGRREEVEAVGVTRKKTAGGGARTGRAEVPSEAGEDPTAGRAADYVFF